MQELLEVFQLKELYVIMTKWFLILVFFYYNAMKELFRPMEDLWVQSRLKIIYRIVENK